MRKFATALVLGCLAAAGAMAAGAQDQEEPLDPRMLAYDKGPAKIDVSKYPPEMKGRYKLFMAKCGSCHTAARAINCEMVLEDEWERYVKRMMRKSGTFISPDEGREIYEFVVYDSKVRKKELYERRAKEAGATDLQ
jgi:hypothetical protein